MVEQCPFKALVEGSSPSQSTTFMPEETHEEQVIRVLGEMVTTGEVNMEQREDGELYFSLNETVAKEPYVYEL